MSRADTEHLLAICRLLAVPTAGMESDNIQMIRSIISKLDNAEGNQAVPPSNELPDSLAFPKATRERAVEQLKGAEFWNKLGAFNDSLRQDYACRRQMLLNRLDCTIESFKWKAVDVNKKSQSAPQDNKLNDLIQEKYDKARQGMRDQPQVAISDLLAVRENECDRLLNSVVSSKSLDCQVAYKQAKQDHQKVAGALVNLKQIIIPDVPDRGGRTSEIRAPPKETFAHQRYNRGRGRR